MPLPSTNTRSPGATFWPMAARSPLTVMRPSRISASIARREATPAEARTFWMRSGTPLGAALAAPAPGFLVDRRGLVRFISGLRDRRRCRRARAEPQQRGLELGRVLDFRQRGQLVERLQVEIVEELRRGAEQRRAPRHFLDADLAHPAALDQRLDDVRRQRYAADLLDLAARDRLAIADQRQGLEQRAREARRPLLPELADPPGVVGAHLQAVAAGHLAQFDGAAVELLAQHLQRGLHVLLGDAALRHEHAEQLVE